MIANAAKLTPGGRVDASGDNRESGLAIGLHLVKRLVGLHTATVTAFSGGVNQGTAIRPTLPVIHADREQQRWEQARTSSRKVLVGDEQHRCGGQHRFAKPVDPKDLQSPLVKDGREWGFPSVQRRRSLPGRGSKTPCSLGLRPRLTRHYRRNGVFVDELLHLVAE